MPVQLAILGSGLFAQNAYLPAIKANSSTLSLHTIWSRSASSAQKLADAAKSLGIQSQGQSQNQGETAVQHGDEGLEAVLQNKEIQGVMMVLPITSQPDLILKALAAGKHVISEKPVGKDIETAKKLIEEYEKTYKPKGLIWRVAESE
jgi:predicted dehydrogenase